MRIGRTLSLGPAIYHPKAPAARSKWPIKHSISQSTSGHGISNAAEQELLQIFAFAKMAAESWPILRINTACRE